MRNYFCTMVIVLLSLPAQGCGNYVEKYSYDELTLTVESDRRLHPPDTPVHLRVTVRNNSQQPFTFNTKGRPLREPMANYQTADPRPVYDLLIFKRAELVWAQSKQAGVEIPTEITVQPGARMVLIDTTWKPEKFHQYVGIILRFADRDYYTGLGIEGRKGDIGVNP